MKREDLDLYSVQACTVAKAAMSDASEYDADCLSRAIGVLRYSFADMLVAEEEATDAEDVNFLRNRVKENCEYLFALSEKVKARTAKRKAS